MLPAIVPRCVLLAPSLAAIADDQSWPHTSASGFAAVRTPAFDRVARAGDRFTNAIVASPGCSPSRAALLTGRQHWRVEQAGTHASSYPAKYVSYPDLLERAGSESTLPPP